MRTRWFAFGLGCCLLVGQPVVRAQETDALPSAPKPLRISSRVFESMKISGTVPEYTAAELAANERGPVVLRATISKEGTVKSTEVVSGPDMLRQQATDAVKDWRYQPYMMNGAPADVETTLIVDFALGKTESVENLVAGHAIFAPNPVYPPQARKARIQGIVTLRAYISEKGVLLHPEVIAGPEELRQAAVDTVKTWRYQPYTVNGVPIGVKTSVAVKFDLKSEPR